MRKDFYAPFLNGSTAFYCQVKFVKKTLFDYSSPYVIEFDDSTIKGLKDKIIVYAKVYNLDIIDMSDLYTKRVTTSYKEVNGFNLMTELRKEGFVYEKVSSDNR